MRSFWGLKISLSSCIVFWIFGSFAQNEPTAIASYKDKKVIYTDLGYNTSPFRINYPFNENADFLRYKNNFKTFMGIGFAYKWFHLRIGFPVFGFVKPVDRWGESQQFQIGFNFTLKKFFFDLDLKTVRGYAIQDYAALDSTFISEGLSNLMMPSIGTTNLSLNGWYFHDRNFKMSALRGKQASYNQTVQTWYLKGTFNGFGVGNNDKGIIPPFLVDNSNAKTEASIYSAFDFGIIPGYAYVTRFKNWQISGWLGFGGVIQSKFYTLNNDPRGFIGLAPRYDIRFIGGYTNDTYFIFLETEFDNKSIGFNDLKYRQYFYGIRLTAGMRFGKN